MNLNNIKIAIFDFDGTLAVHKNKNYLKEKRDYSYILKTYMYPEIFYTEIEKCNINENIQKLIIKLKKNNTKIYCVYKTDKTLSFKAKECFINKNYGNNIEIIGVTKEKDKLLVAKILKKKNKCELNEVLYVDTYINIAELMKNNEILGITSSDINSI